MFNDPTMEFLPYSVPCGPLDNSALSKSNIKAAAACGLAT